MSTNFIFIGLEGQKTPKVRSVIIFRGAKYEIQIEYITYNHNSIKDPLDAEKNRATDFRPLQKKLK